MIEKSRFVYLRSPNEALVEAVSAVAKVTQSGYGTAADPRAHWCELAFPEKVTIPEVRAAIAKARVSFAVPRIDLLVKRGDGISQANQLEMF